MANNNDSAIVRVEENGIEYFTVKATGESGMSQRGLARACGKRIFTIQNLIENLTNEAPSKWLKPFVGKGLTLTNGYSNSDPKTRNVTIYLAAFCSATIKHYAYKGSEKAQDFDAALGEIGLTSYIQTQTGWLPEQYTAAPAAHKQLNRILDTPNPWVKLYDPDFCRQVYKWYDPQFYWIFCYCFLTPVERCKVDQLNPAIKGDRKHRIHQYLEEDTKQRLAPHVWQLIAIVNTAGEDKQLFLTGYQKHFEGLTQLTLM